MQAPPPNQQFLSALVSRHSICHNALPRDIAYFYREAVDLRTSFEKDDLEPLPPAHAGLISIFDEKVTVTGADRTKPQANDTGSVFFHADPSTRPEEGSSSFVQGAMLGFRRNWRIFSQDSLGGLNWYAFHF